MTKRSVIILILLLFTSQAVAQTNTGVPTAQPPEIIDELAEPPRSGAIIDFDDIEEFLPDDVDPQFPPQWAVGETFALVSVEIANLRNLPYIEDSVVIDTAVWGERFAIIGVYYPGESTVREPESNDFVFDDPNEREVWYLVEVNGGAAWVFGGIVIVANPETLDAFLNRTLTEEQQAYIDAQVALAQSTVAARVTSRMRSGPGTNFAQVGIIPFPGRVTVIGRNEFSTWFYVDYNGTQGWVSFSLLALPQNFDALAVPIVR